MPSPMDYTLYQTLTPESFKLIPSSTLTVLEPSFLSYSSHLSVIICSQCREALPGKTSLARHLTRPPHNIYWKDLTKSTRDAILSKLSSYSILSYHTLPAIPPNVYYFDCLPVRFDTYKCPDCDHFTIDSKKARQHRVQIHNSRWEKKTKRPDIIYNIPAQLLFPQSHRGLFIPKLPTPPSYISEPSLPLPVRPSRRPSPPVASEISTSPRILDDPLLLYLQKEEQAISMMSTNENLTSKNTSSFLRNSRFNTFHEDKDIPSLLELIAPIKSNAESCFTILHSVAIKLQSKISALLPRIIRPVRLELKEEEHTQFTTFTKDFIELEVPTRRVYFAIFGDLFIFLLRLLEKIECEEPDQNYPYLEKLRLSLLLEDLHRLRRITRTLTVEIFESYNEQSLFFLESTLVNIVMQLLRTEIRFETTLEYTTFYNPMILFFILRSINPGDNSFKSESVISKLASKIIYGSRLFLLGSIWVREKQQIENPSSTFNVAGYYRTNLVWVTVSKGHNYFEEVARIRRYLLKVLKERVSDNKPIIDIGPDTYLVYANKYSFRGLYDLHGRIVNELRDILFNRLILLPRRDLPRLNLLEMEDNANISTPGYYLPDNPSFKSIGDFMRRQLVTPTSPIYRSLIKRIDSNGTRSWWRTKVLEFLHARQTFIKLLLLASHLTSGSPLRGTEWEYTTLRNLRGSDSYIRDIIWDRHQNLIRITTHWHKSRNITRQNRPNVRFLPPTLSYILVYYILFTMPVYYFINLEYLQERQISPFLFEINGRRIESPTLSRMLYIKSSEIFRSGLTLNPYRHLINHILLEKIGSRVIEFIDSSEEGIEPEVERDDSIIDLQANRSTKTGEHHYSLLATQPGGGVRSQYIRTIQFTQRYQALFRLDKLHPDFEFLDPVLGNSEQTLVGLDPAEDSSRAQEHTASRIDVYYQLTRFFQDKNAQFRDIFQKEAILAIFESITYLTYINKTGSGKSLLYLLPAYIRYQDMVNVVITPRVSLRDDLLKRAVDRKIRAACLDDVMAEINESHTYPSYNLIVTSIESILDSSFTEYIIQLVRSHRPVRLYIDEAHTIILEKNFRWVMKYVNSLLQYRLPIVFISATLPVPLLRLIEVEFLLPRGANRIIRSNTIRENIEYEIVNIDHAPEDKDIQSILKTFQRRGLGPKNKAIIFVPSYQVGNALAEKSRLPFYNANNARKEPVLESFLKDPTILVILATSALSLGVDFNVVGFTLHVPPFYGGIIDFIQGSSRIRRGGLSVILQQKRSEALKSRTRDLYEELDLSKITTLEQFKSTDRLIFQKLLNEDHCLRQITSYFLDNIDIVNCLAYNMRSSAKVALCYICRREQDILSRQATQEETLVQRTNIGLARFEDIVDTFTHANCLFCLVLGNIDNFPSHPFINCSEWEDKTFYTRKGIDQSLQIRLATLSSRLSSRSSLIRGSCCYRCLLPSRVCHHLKEIVNKDLNDQCVYPWLIRALIVIYELQLELNKDSIILKALGLDNLELHGRPGDVTGILELCLKPVKIFDTDAIMACQILLDLNLEKVVNGRENIENRGRKKRVRAFTDLTIDDNIN